MRLMCAAIDRAAFVWCGPDHTKPALLKEDFLKFFGKRCAADCNVFAGADTVENVEAERARRAEHAGVPVEKMPSATALDFMKTSKQKEYMQRYVELLPDRVGHLSKTMVCDLSQNPAKRLRCGPWSPSPTRGMDLCLLNQADGARNRGYFFTAGELGLMMGWPTVTAASNRKYRQCMSFELGKLTARQQRSLQGNGMHLCSMASYLAWIFSHCLRRDVVREYLPQLRCLDHFEPESSEHREA